MTDGPSTAPIYDGAPAAATEARRSICGPTPRAGDEGAAGTVLTLFPHLARCGGEPRTAISSRLYLRRFGTDHLPPRQMIST